MPGLAEYASLPPLAELDFLGLSPFVLWRLFWTVWIGMLGAAVGSFLNVAIYRLPAGLNVAHPPSRCPRCGTRIRWYDNVPMLSWLLLGGQCRDCGGAISARYPGVELLTALLFVAMYWADGAGEGTNLPLRYLEGAGVTADVAYRWHPTLLGLTLGYHLVLVAALVAVALMAHDGAAPPTTLIVVTWAVGLAMPLVSAWVRPTVVDAPWIWREGAEAIRRSTAWHSWSAALPAATLLILGAIVLWTAPIATRLRDRLAALLFAVTAAALFLGWQATLMAAAATGGLYVVVRPLGAWLRIEPIPSWLLALLPGVIVAIAAWERWEVRLHNQPWPTLLAAAGLSLAAPLAVELTLFFLGRSSVPSSPRTESP